MKRTMIALTAVAVLAVGCGGQQDDVGGRDTTPPTTQDDGGSAAGGTTMRVYTVDEALAGDVTNPIHVSGLLVNGGDGWQLCSAVLESYPPQCGGESITVEGVDESEFNFEEASGVQWAEGATVVGDLEGNTLTVTGSAASS